MKLNIIFFNIDYFFLLNRTNKRRGCESACKWPLSGRCAAYLTDVDFMGHTNSLWWSGTGWTIFPKIWGKFLGLHKMGREWWGPWLGMLGETDQFFFMTWNWLDDFPKGLRKVLRAIQKGAETIGSLLARNFRGNSTVSWNSTSITISGNRRSWGSISISPISPIWFFVGQIIHTDESVELFSKLVSCLIINEFSFRNYVTKRIK